MKCPCTHDRKMIGDCACFNMAKSRQLDPIGCQVIVREEKSRFTEEEQIIITRAIGRVYTKMKAEREGRKYFPKINLRK